MKLSIEIQGLTELRQALRGFSERRLNAAVATGLTRTARVVAEQWRQEMQQKLDRPTPFTLRAVRVEQATAQKLAATVFLRGAAMRPGQIEPDEYMATQEQGGSRAQRKFERALQAQGSMPAGMFVVPGKHAVLVAFGNISRGQIVQVLAQLGAAYSPGYARVISKSAAKRAATAIKRGRNYVAVLEQRGKLVPGVYQVQGDELLPVFFYERRTKYRKRVDLIQRAQQVVPVTINQEIKRALAEQLQRMEAQAKGGA